jgi:tetratricopeptide (TPR) repeat protein
VLDCFYKALQIDPNNYYAHYNIGYQLYHSEDNCKEAREVFERAYELNQEDPTLNFYLGICDLEQSNIGGCERYFSESIRTSGFSAEFYIKVIEKLIKRDNWILARKFCNEGRSPDLHFSNQKLKEYHTLIEKSLSMS